MSTIDPSTRILAQIRALALEWRQRAGDAAGSRVLDDHQPMSAADRPQDWMAQVARAVVAIEPNDPDRRRKAFRIYLQAVLVRECGIRRADDPGFQDLVDRVQQAMEADPRLRSSIETAGNMLLESAS
jgi:hypothetical protein